MSTALLEAGVVTMIVDRLSVLKSTDTYVLYEVEAHNVDGVPFGTRLRTFDDLPTDTPITVTLENYTPKKGGDPSLTVKYPQGSRKRKAQTKPAADDTRIAQLESRVEKLERTLRAIIGNPDMEIPT
jgi:hypothetical protein